MTIHSSIPFKVIAIYPSIEHKGKIAILVSYPDLRQEVLYLTNS